MFSCKLLLITFALALLVVAQLAMAQQHGAAGPAHRRRASERMEPRRCGRQRHSKAASNAPSSWNNATSTAAEAQEGTSSVSSAAAEQTSSASSSSEATSVESQQLATSDSYSGDG